MPRLKYFNEQTNNWEPITSSSSGNISIETDPTVPAWAKADTKPTYSKSEVGLGNVDNVKQYSAENPPVVYQSNKPKDTSVIWVDIDDDSDDGFQEAVNYALAQAKASGEFDGEPGEKGDTGMNGHSIFFTTKVSDNAKVGEMIANRADVVTNGRNIQIGDFLICESKLYIIILINNGTVEADLVCDLKGDVGPAYTLNDTDKTEMVNAVIAALPIYNGEVG